MLPATRKKSNRLTGNKPSPPPKLSSVKKGKGLAQLLATDCSRGRILYNEDASVAWNLSPTPSSTTAPSAPVPASQRAQSDVSSLTASVSTSKKRPALSDSDKRRLMFEKNKTGTPSSSMAPTDADAEPPAESGFKLLRFDQLKTMIEDRCVCRFCGCPLLLTQDTKGLATKLFLTCKPKDGRCNCHSYKIIPTRVPPVITENMMADRRKLPKDSAKVYLQNYMFVLLMQELGIGLKRATAILGLLGIRHSIGNDGTWKQIQDRFGEAEQAVKEEILKENIEKAREAAMEKGEQPDPDLGGRVGIVGSMDQGWNKRSSGHTYDSLSGQNLLICCLTKLILGVVCLSKVCAACKGNNEPDVDEVPDIPDIEDEDDEDEDEEEALKGARLLVPARGHRCPKNFEGSSKAMEPIAAAKLVDEAYRSGRIYVKTVVGDDDSTTRAVLTTDWQTYRDDFPDIPKEDFWPTYETPKLRITKFVQRKKLPGRLHWETPVPTRFLCDPTHRIRIIAKYLFKMIKEFTKYGVTKTDCERLKENMGYAHKQFRDVLTLDEYKRAWDAALWHMANEHKYCDPSWCPYGYAPGGKSQEKNNHALAEDEKKFLSLKKVFYTYNTPHYLEQMHHPYDSQKNESVHNRVAKVAPKTTTLCTTFTLNDRIALVVIIDSVGYEVGVARIFQKLCGVASTSFNFPTETQIWMHNIDRDAAYHKQYQEKVEVKAKRATKKKEKIKEGIQNDRDSRYHGHYYSTGVAVAKPDDDESAAPPPAKKARKNKPAPAKKQTKKPKQATEKTKKKCGTKRKAIAEPMTGGEASTTSATRITSLTAAASGGAVSNAGLPAPAPAPAASVQSTQKPATCTKNPKKKRARKL
jgi:hypothetical protein